MCDQCKALYDQLAPTIIPITEELTKDFHNFLNLIVEKYGTTLIAPFDHEGNALDLKTMEPKMKAEWDRSAGQAAIAWLNGFHAVQTDYYENLCVMINNFTEQGFMAGAAYAHHQKEIVKN